MIIFFLSLPLLVILTINFLVDSDSVTGMNYGYAKLNDLFINSKIDSTQKRVRNLYYSPLPLTNNSWTLIDIRRGSRRKTPYKIGVSSKTELDIGDHTYLIASNANRTVQSNIVIYNRVPKCGSTSVKRILIHLAKKNSFKFEISQIFWRWDGLVHIHQIHFPASYFREALQPSEEKSLFSRLTQQKSKYVFNRHFFIFNRNHVPDTKVIRLCICKTALALSFR